MKVRITIKAVRVFDLPVKVSPEITLREAEESAYEDPILLIDSDETQISVEVEQAI